MLPRKSLQFQICYKLESDRRENRGLGSNWKGKLVNLYISEMELIWMKPCAWPSGHVEAWRMPTRSGRHSSAGDESVVRTTAESNFELPRSIKCRSIWDWTHLLLTYSAGSTPYGQESLAGGDGNTRRVSVNEASAWGQCTHPNE
jgi:hypothetical protein